MSEFWERMTAVVIGAIIFMFGVFMGAIVFENGLGERQERIESRRIERRANER